MVPGVQFGLQQQPTSTEHEQKMHSFELSISTIYFDCNRDIQDKSIAKREMLFFDYSIERHAPVRANWGLVASCSRVGWGEENHVFDVSRPKHNNAQRTA